MQSESSYKHHGMHICKLSTDSELTRQFTGRMDKQHLVRNYEGVHGSGIRYGEFEEV